MGRVAAPATRGCISISSRGTPPSRSAPAMPSASIGPWATALTSARLAVAGVATPGVCTITGPRTTGTGEAVATGITMATGGSAGRRPRGGAGGARASPALRAAVPGELVVRRRGADAGAERAPDGQREPAGGEHGDRLAG